MHFVLVVTDDNEDIAFIEEAFLAQPGTFSIKTIRTASLLVEYLQGTAVNNFPSLIIVNNYLTDMDSQELLEKIKANPLHKLIPVAVMAGFATEDTIRRFYLGGANCFYKKPMDRYEWNHMADCLITLFCRS